MKNNVIILGNLKECKRARAKIDMDLINSLTFVTTKNDINDKWFKDKNRFIIHKIKELEYDLIFIASETISEFKEFHRQLIKQGVENKKIWYNFNIDTFNLMLKDFTKYNSGTLKYKTDFFMEEKPTDFELKKLDFQSMNRLEKYFYRNNGKIIHKFLHYFEIYDRHFSRFFGKDVTVLEIGVSKGGSLELWRDYFGSKCKIYGIDIDPKCKNLESEQIEIFIGDAEDRNFLRTVKEKVPEIDILIDDGGHYMNQQIVAFEELYPIISPDGVYLCEDLMTSYMDEYEGGYRRKNTFIEYSKDLIDYLNAWYFEEKKSWFSKKKLSVNKITLSTHSMHYYNNVLVIEKRKMDPPFAAIMGNK
ncbi:SAM-dependent methyltransferase [Methanobacterium oryzae]|uniref:SAM-dependent methyltransferase n=1 Tax=Methanobacterium oryzae TaxID=69540 RepID=UPI003D217ED1